MSALVLGCLKNGVAIVTLNRPEAGNAMSLSLTDALLSVIEGLAADAGTRAWLIRAEGKNFCVGGDISTFGGDGDQPVMLHTLATRVHDSLKILHAHRAPVVMAVNGVAAGAGFSMVSGADIAIAGRSATFLAAYSAIGLTADGGATWNLPRVVGMRRAQELLFTGRRLTAEEAADIGLITRVAADEALQDEALEVARVIALGPTGAYGAVKQLLARSFVNSYPAQLAEEADSMRSALAKPDGANAVRAFLAKRKPEFTGD